MVRDNQRVAEYLRSLESRIDQAEAALTSGQGGDGLPTQLKTITDRGQVQDSLSVSVGSASSGTIIDDYEDQSLSEYSGDTGHFNFVTSPVYNGSYALEMPSVGQREEIVSTSGLSNYPQTGGTPFGWHFQADFASNFEIKILWSVTTEDISTYDGYGIQIEPSRVLLARFANGGYDSTLDSASWSPAENTWYRFDVTEWTSAGNITAKAKSADGSTTKATLSATDDTYDADGIGVNATHDGGGTGYLDYYVIR